MLFIVQNEHTNIQRGHSAGIIPTELFFPGGSFLFQAAGKLPEVVEKVLSEKYRSRPGRGGGGVSRNGGF